MIISSYNIIIFKPIDIHMEFIEVIKAILICSKQRFKNFWYELFISAVQMVDPYYEHFLQSAKIANLTS